MLIGDLAAIGYDRATLVGGSHAEFPPMFVAGFKIPIAWAVSSVGRAVDF